MPKLFKRRKKRKLGIRDALATVPGFIAVPHAPHPQLVGGAGLVIRSSPTQPHPQPLPPPPPALSDTGVTGVTSTGSGGSTMSQLGTRNAHSAARQGKEGEGRPRPPTSTGTQSEWPPSDEGSDAEFGYATVRGGKLRSKEEPGSSSLPEANTTGRLLPTTSSSSQPTLERDSSPRGSRSHHSHDSDIDSPAVSPQPAMPPPSQLKEGSGGNLVSAGTDGLYAKVKKPQHRHQSRQHGGKKSGASDLLPPKPPTTTTITITSPQATSATSSATSQASKRGRGHHHADSAHKSKQGLSLVVTQHPEGASRREGGALPRGKGGVRESGATGQVEVKKPIGVGGAGGEDGGEGWAGQEVSEYTDEEYLLSGDDSFSLTDTSFSEEHLLSTTTASAEAKKPRSQNHHHRQSSTPVGHHPHHHAPFSTTPPRPSNPTPSRSGGRNATQAASLIHRPASAPDLDNIPLIRPSFIRQLSPARPHSQPLPLVEQPHPLEESGEVYIFSERQADGSEQFYAATPVRTFARSHSTPIQSPPTPPLIQQPPPPSVIMATPTDQRGAGFGSFPESGLSTSGVSSTPQAATRQPSPGPLASHALPPGGVVLTQQSRDKGQVPPLAPGTVVGTKITKLGASPGDISLVSSHGGKSRMDEPDDDMGLVVGGGVDETHLDHTYLHKLKEKVQSLASDKETLRKQLVEERRHLRTKEGQLTRLKDQMAKLRAENDRLADEKQSLELERVSVDHQCLELRGEKSALSRQLEIIKARMKEMKLSHQTKVSLLDEEVQVMRSEREDMQTKMTGLAASHTHLQSQFERLTSSLPAHDHVSLREHQQALHNIQSVLDGLCEENEDKLRSQDALLKMRQRENKSLVVKLTDAAAVITKLEEENRQLQKCSRKAEEKVLELQYQLDCSRDREVEVHNQLSGAVRKAEKTTAEKKALAKIAKAQRRSVERAAASELENSLTINTLEKKLEACEEALFELDRVSAVKSKTHKKQYEEEIKHLRTVLTRKQQQVEQLARDKRTAEGQLDLLWSTTGSGTSGWSPTLDLLKNTSYRSPNHRFTKSFT